MSTYRFTTRVAYPDVDLNFQLTIPGALRMMQEAAIYHSAERLQHQYQRDDPRSLDHCGLAHSDAGAGRLG